MGKTSSVKKVSKNPISVISQVPWYISGVPDNKTSRRSLRNSLLGEK
jgi:hypothetical protein